MGSTSRAAWCKHCELNRIIFIVVDGGCFCLLDLGDLSQGGSVYNSK